MYLDNNRVNTGRTSYLIMLSSTHSLDYNFLKAGILKSGQCWSVTCWTLAGLPCDQMTQGHNKTDILCLQPIAHCGGLVCVCLKTYTEVSVPDLDGAILAAGCNELPITAVGAARGDDLLPLQGAWFEHWLVLLLWFQVPCAHSAVNRQKKWFILSTAMNHI